MAIPRPVPVQNSDLWKPLAKEIAIFLVPSSYEAPGRPGRPSHSFTDQGEPGTHDTESMTIMDPSGSPALSFGATNLTFGNHQAHSRPGASGCNK